MKLLLFLLVGGAIINVVVAWGCPHIMPDDDQHEMSNATADDFARYGTEIVEQVRTATAFVRFNGRELGSSWEATFVYHSDELSFLEHGGDYGWPMKCVQGRELWRDDDVVNSTGWLSLRTPAKTYRFAYGPIFPGFAINTIFYAAVLWLLFAAPFALRTRIRIKRGQCASCGYSLRGTPDNEKCPECGATA